MIGRELSDLPVRLVGMVDPALLEQVVGLPADERRELIAYVQESLDNDERSISPELAALIDERVAEAMVNPGAGRTWDEVRASLRERHVR